MFKKISENLWINQYGITAKTKELEKYIPIKKIAKGYGHTWEYYESHYEPTGKFTVFLGREDLKLDLSYEEAVKFIESYDEMFKESK